MLDETLVWLWVWVQVSSLDVEVLVLVGLSGSGKHLWKQRGWSVNEFVGIISLLTPYWSPYGTVQYVPSQQD